MNLRPVRPDEREPEGAVSYAVIIEDLTAARNQVIELEGEAHGIPGTEGENMRAQLSGLRVHIEAIIGLAQAERANL